MSNTNRLALENDVYCGVCGNCPEGTCPVCGQTEAVEPLFYFAHVRHNNGLESFYSFDSPLLRTIALIALQGFADVLEQGEGTKAELEPRWLQALAVANAWRADRLAAKGTV